MQSTQVTFDLERTKALFRRYFNFERKSALAKTQTKYVLVFALVFIAIGWATGVHFFWIIGLIAVVLIVLFIGFYVVRFQLQIDHYLKQLDKTPSNDFQFSFDAQSLVYQSADSKTEYKWNAIKEYSTNDGDVYLYLENRELLDIIAEQILGKEMFKEFMEVLTQKVPQE